MTDQVSLDGSWMNDITPKTATLKIQDREVVNLVFKDNGRKKESKDYGNSVAFLVRVDGQTEDKTFYVKANNFDLLGQISAIAKANGGVLIGLRCQISRTGKLKSDTRYSIKKL